LAKGNKRTERRLTSAPSQHAAVFQPELVEDLRFWVETNRKIALRALNLVDTVRRDPRGHRQACAAEVFGAVLLVASADAGASGGVRVADDRIDFLQARYHY
jgi:toxin YoeB